MSGGLPCWLLTVFMLGAACVAHVLQRVLVSNVMFRSLWFRQVTFTTLILVAVPERGGTIVG